MPKFKVACTWRVYGEFEVKARSLKSAIKKVLDNTAIPETGEYIDDSFMVDIYSTRELNDMEGLWNELVKAS